MCRRGVFMLRRGPSPFIAVPIFLSLALTEGFAQTSQGTIAGTVTDPTGAVVIEATVTAKNVNGSDNRTVKTGSNGEYRIDAVTPSTYTVSISKTGFSTKQIGDVAVAASVVTS